MADEGTTGKRIEGMDGRGWGDERNGEGKVEGREGKRGWIGDGRERKGSDKIITAAAAARQHTNIKV